jgi:hypothetical protein
MGVLVMLTFAGDEHICMPTFSGWNWSHEGKLVQVHHPQDLILQPHGSCSGNSCLTFSSISHFVKLEMFAIAGRRWLPQGVSDVVLLGLKMCSLYQVRTKTIFCFFTSQTERQHLKLGVHKFSTNPGPHINVLDDRRVT